MNEIKAATTARKLLQRYCRRARCCGYQRFARGSPPRRRGRCHELALRIWRSFRSLELVRFNETAFSSPYSNRNKAYFFGPLRGMTARTSAASRLTFGLELCISRPAREAFAGDGERGLLAI